MRMSKPRGFLWIGVLLSTGILSGVYLLVPVGGVCLLYLWVRSFPKCFITLRFWLVVAFPLLLGFFLPTIGWEEAFVFAGKGCIFLLLAEYLRRRISPRGVEELMDRWGLGGLGFAFTVALNSLASVGDKVRTVWGTIRMRGGFRRPVAGLRTFIEAVLYAVLLQGEEIYLAARARGYGGSDPEGQFLPRSSRR
jgi:hypothetical protein